MGWFSVKGDEGDGNMVRSFFFLKARQGRERGE